MRGKTLIGSENVRINGVWRVVDVYADVLAIACRLGPKAARTKSGRSKLAGGGIVAKVRDHQAPSPKRRSLSPNEQAANERAAESHVTGGGE